jgi:hypothetical protein
VKKKILGKTLSSKAQDGLIFGKMFLKIFLVTLVPDVWEDKDPFPAIEIVFSDFLIVFCCTSHTIGNTSIIV